MKDHPAMVLISIAAKDATHNRVSARSLYKALDINRDFHSWVRDKMNTLGFVPGADFITEDSTNSEGYAVIDYMLSVPASLEIVMSGRGGLARFARCQVVRQLQAAEQKLAALPADWSKDSSLKTWFPWTAEQLAELQQPIKLPHAEGEEKQEYLDKVIEVLNGAGLQIRYHCPRCNGLLDLTSRPDGDHYCHQHAKVEGE